MLYLNNTLLTSELIIEAFRQEVVGCVPSAPSRAPSPLSRLKDKLKANFFNELTGCDLVLLSGSPKDTDLTTMPKKTPLLFKQGDQYFIGRSEGHQWLFTELEAGVIEEARLEFPVAGEAPYQLPYHTKLQRLMNHIHVKDDQINMNKKPSDRNVLEVLATDSRFKSEYPCLKYVLTQLFSLTDADNPADALRQLEESHLIDWTSPAWNTQYQRLNAQYGYFEGLDEAKMASVHALFNALATTCRTMIVLFEHNNNYTDTLAYEYAYKLMALLLDPDDLNHPDRLFDKISKETYKLLSTSDNSKGKPFHDVLLVSLHLPPARDLADKKGWMKLIKQEGIKAFHFLAMAKKMEQKIAELETPLEQKGAPPLRAPTNLKEALTIAKHCRYERARENLEFAELCYAHGVKEERFNRCLDYLAAKWPRKHEDSIPNVMIIGEKEASGFVWVKLPVDDKRALILGDITMCCQSIGGESEACVKDAVSRTDNGLYVLLRQRTGRHPAPLIEGQINYANFDIVGQAYVWKSTTGNLCLDSIECLSSVPHSVIKRIVEDFATEVLTNSPAIRRVTVGRGGKTPPNLFAESTIAERMKQGTLYGDAYTQYCVGVTPYHRFNKSQLDVLMSLLRDYPAYFIDNMMYLCEYFPDKDTLVGQLGVLLHELPNLAEELTRDELNVLLALNNNPTLEDLKPVDFDELDRLLPAERATHLATISTARLLWRTCHNSDTLIRALPYIPKDELFNIVQLMKLYGDGNRMRYWTPTQRNIVYHAVKDRLPELVNSAEDFKRMMTILAPEQCAFVCHGIKHRLQDIMTAYDFCQSFPSEHEKRVAISQALADQLPHLIHTAQDYHWGTMMLYDQGKEVVYTAMKDKMMDLIKSSNDFSDMLESFYPDNRKTAFCVDMVDKLPAEIATQSKVFEAMMKYLPEEPRATFCQLHKTAFLTSIRSVQDFTDGIRRFPKEQRASIYEEIKDTLIPMIQSADDFFSVRSIFEPQQRTDLYEALKDKLPAMLEQKMAQQEFRQTHGLFGDSETREVTASQKLINIINRFSVSELIELLPAIRTMIGSVFTSFLVCQEVFSSYAIYDREKCQLIYELIQNALIAGITTVSSYNYALNGLPLEQGLSLYESLKGTLPDILPPQAITRIASVDEFTSVLERFSPKRQVAFYEEWKDRLPDFIQSGNDLSKLRRHLPVEQRIALYQSVNLPTLITNVEDYCQLIEVYSIDMGSTRQITEVEGVFIYEAMKSYLPGFVQSSGDFKAMMKAYILEQKQKEFYETMKAKLPSLIGSLSDFLNVMEYLTEAQRTEVYEQVTDKLRELIRDCNEFHCATKFLTEAQRTAFFLEQQSQWLDKIHTANDFCYLRDRLPKEYHQSLWEAKLMNNISTHINATVPGVNCKPLACALLTSYEEIKNQLDALFQSINCSSSPLKSGFFENKKLIARLIDALSSLESKWLERINTALDLKLSAEQLGNFSEVKAALVNYCSEADRPVGDNKLS